jgi:hypothetical protein
VLVALWIGAAWGERPTTLLVPSTTTPASATPTRTEGPDVSATQINLVGSPSTGSTITVRQATATGKLLFAGLIRPGAMRQFPTAGGIWLGFDATTGVQLFVAGRPVEIPGGISRLDISESGVVRPG